MLLKVEAWKFVKLGGTTRLTLLVYYGLVCSLRHYLSVTANIIRCIVRRF